jgi:uncharacterized protein YbaP (TraB family)
MTKHIYKKLSLLFLILFAFQANSQTQQKGLLWQISGKGMKKPSYVYGTMHVSEKIAFHLGDSFYIALSKCDVVALEQNLDSVIHKWISENEYEGAENANRVHSRNTYEYLNIFDFTLNSYNKNLIKRKLSAEVREVNYLLQRGNQDDFEEDAWLDLYIYQIAKKLGKGFTGVEGYEESRDLVKKSRKEPKDAKKKKPKRYNYKLRQQVADAYRKGDIYMLDSIDRMTETEHYLEYMLYKRNANMVRRMDSIMSLGKSMFTGVGCSHLPGSKGVLQMLIEKGYKVRPVQSIALEKSKMAEKYENMPYKHKYKTFESEDGWFSADLPTQLTRVNNNSDYASYLSPDLANGQYYQIEKISCNSVFSGKSPEEILMVIDTMIFENIPGDIKSKQNIVSNGFHGIEVVTELKTGDLNRFHILVSPFNVYIVRMSGKKSFATSSDASNFFKSLKINEGRANNWKTIASPDSVFSIQLPTNEKSLKLPMSSKVNPSFEYLVYEKQTGNTYLIKQLDILNQKYLEEDTFELDVMAMGFAKTDNFKVLKSKHFHYHGYHALDVEYLNNSDQKLYARFVISGTRYIMFLMMPSNRDEAFNNKFFTSIQFNGKPKYEFIEYQDTTLLFKVKTPVLPLYTKKDDESMFFGYSESEEDMNPLEIKYQGNYEECYFKTDNTNEFLTVGRYKYGYYENLNKSKEEFRKMWSTNGSMKLTHSKQGLRNGVQYYVYNFTDTNTTRNYRVMQMLHGLSMYYVEAYLDTVTGESDFVKTFFNTFDVGDTFIQGNIFSSKSKRFIDDFTSKDSLRRKYSIKYLKDVNFTKNDIKDLCNIIDTIQLNGDAGHLRTQLINELSQIDSAQEIIVPYFEKLYQRFSDTAFMQIIILKAIANQKSDKAFKTIKPILSNDIPISDNSYEMSEMLEAFGDSLKLTKLILPELIELTNLTEYRDVAYSLISRMKDSGIINENDYASIHNKLVNETKIEYKRMMASITKFKGNSNSYEMDYYDFDISAGSDISTSSVMMDNFGYYDDYYGDYGSYNLLSDILDLSLPLRNKNKTIEEIVGKILKITQSEQRLSLMPVMLKYNINFNDTVYESLAKNPKTRMKFYNVLREAGHLEKFPSQYKTHSQFIASAIENLLSKREELDTAIFIEKRKVILGRDTGLIYVYKIKIVDEEQEALFFTELMNVDTTRLYPNNYKSENRSRRYGNSYGDVEAISGKKDVNSIIGDFFFKSLMRYKRERNGGWFTSYMYNAYSSDYYDWDY